MGKGLWVLLCISLGCGSSSGLIHSDGGVCLSDTEVASTQSPIDQFNQQSFQAALTAQALGLITLTAISVQESDQQMLAAPTTPTPSSTFPYYTAGIVYQITLQGTTQSYIAGATRNCGLTEEFVTDAQGNVGLLSRQANTLSKQSVDACMHACGCGIPAAEQNLYVLPVGKSYLGRVAVSYNVKELDFNCTVYLE